MEPKWVSFDDRYRELKEREREIGRLRQTVPMTAELQSRIAAMTAEVKEAWRELADEILKREG
jgi:hypothetical protein